MMVKQVKKMAVLGLGLIGGSLSLAAKKYSSIEHVIAWGRNEDSLKHGLELGVIDDYSADLEKVIENVDIIVVATPVVSAEKLLVDLFERHQTRAIVTDVGSTKSNFINAFTSKLGYIPQNLVLGHPIAGSENSGVFAADSELFVDHRVILTPTETTSNYALSVVSKLWEDTGANVVHMSAKHHDCVLGATSHLPHMLAYTIMDTLIAMQDEQEIFKFAAGGFRDFTRISMSSPVMWRDIALSNKESLLMNIDKFSEHLNVLKKAISDDDGDKLLAMFSHVSETRKTLHDKVLPKENK
jgi:cyclohexadieny/prephenate dehydrogenase